MTPAEIIEFLAEEGVVLAISTTGNIKATGDQLVINEWLMKIRNNKSGILCELQREQRLAKVLELLEVKQIGLFVDDDRTDPVIATVAIRNFATFEMAIPQHSYNGMLLLELIEKYYGENNE